MKHFFLFLVCATAILMTGCSDDKDVNPPPQGTLAISVSEITGNSAKVTVTPSSETMAYFPQVIAESLFAEHHASDVATYLRNYMGDKDKWGNKSMTEIAAEISKYGNQTLKVTQLEPNTKYVAFAVGIDKSGVITTEPVTKAFTTGSATMTETISVTVSDITGNGAKVTITPSSQSMAYFPQVITEALFAEHHASDVATFLRNYMGDKSIWGDKSMAEIAAEISKYGTQTLNSIQLEPSTKYVAFAVGIDKNGALITAPAIEPFTTTEKVIANLTFEVNILKQGIDNIDFEVVPSNQELSYYVTIMPISFTQSRTSEELLTWVLNEYSFVIPYMCYTGTTPFVTVEGETSFTYYRPDTGYELLIFGYDTESYTASTELTQFALRTDKSPTSPTACTFQVAVTGLTSRSATVSITPSDVLQPYAWDLIAESDYNAYKDNMKGYLERYVNEVGMDLLDADVRVHGESGSSFSEQLKPNTTYYIWAACIDEFGKPTAEVLMSNPFTTLEPVIGTSTVSVVLNNYFDGDKVYELYPEAAYEQGRGMAYVSLTFSASEGASVWYGLLSEGDLSNSANLSDEECIEKFIGNMDFMFPTGVLRWADWDAPYTVLAVAKDKDQNYSKVLRQVYTFTKEGANPIEEFVKPAPNSLRLLSSFLGKLTKPAAKAQVIHYKPAAKK